MIEPGFSSCNVYLWEPSYRQDKYVLPCHKCWPGSCEQGSSMICFVSDMDIEDVRDYEKDMQEKTNHKVGAEV